MSERIVTYVKVDVMNSKKIHDRVLKDDFEKYLGNLMRQISEGFGNVVTLVSKEGDGGMYETESLNDAIKASLDICKVNRENPMGIPGIKEDRSYRLDLRIILVTGYVREENIYQKLLGELSAIEKAEDYSPNSVILNLTAFNLAKDFLRNEKIVNEPIEIEYSGNEHTVYCISYAKDGSVIIKTKLYLLKEIIELKDNCKKLEKEVIDYKTKLEKEVIDYKTKLKKSHKNMMIFYVIVAVISIISVVVGYEYLDYKNQVYENKYDDVKAYLVNKFQSFIDVSHIQENAIKLGYEKNMSKKEFIDKKIIDLKQSDLYVKDKIPVDGTFYFYIMNSTCHFLAYSHNANMKRIDGQGLEACEDKTHDLFVTDNYPSTGTEGFVNAIVNKIFLGDDDGKADLTSSIAIDWDSISEKIRSHIDLPNVKFVLTDSQQFLLMDCNSKECSSMQEYATTHYASIEGVTANSIGPKYDPQNYSGYSLCKDETFHPDFNTYGKLRTKILENWHLRMYVSDLVTPAFCSK